MKGIPRSEHVSQLVYLHWNPGPGQRLGWVNPEEHWEASGWGALSANVSTPGKDE